MNNDEKITAIRRGLMSAALLLLELGVDRETVALWFEDVADEVRGPQMATQQGGQ